MITYSAKSETGVTIFQNITAKELYGSLPAGSILIDDSAATVKAKKIHGLKAATYRTPDGRNIIVSVTMEDGK